MRSPALLAAGLISVVIAAGLMSAGEVRRVEDTAKLPGAQSVIEATDYASLQAAIDAVPVGGGLVRLPPGTFEISEPLRLRAEDVVLEGAGTSTHIENVSAEGEPALVIEPPPGERSIWRIRLANFRITGNPGSGSGIAHNLGGGIDLRDAHGCAVSANTFTVVPERALAVGPDSGRITITGNNFCDSCTGGRTKRSADDCAASGIVLNGTSDVAICANLFAGLDAEALSLAGKASRRVLFTDNVLTRVQGMHGHLEQSRVAGNLH